MKVGAPRLVALVLPLLGCGGGASEDTPCIEQRTAVALPAEVMAMVAGMRRAPIQFGAGAAASEVTFQVVSPMAFQVTSRKNPGFTNPAGVACRDHLALVGAVQIASADGRLDERWTDGELVTLEGGRLHFDGLTPANQVRGSYRGIPSEGFQFDAVQIVVALTPTTFSGQLYDVLAKGEAIVVRPGVSWTATDRP